MIKDLSPILLTSGLWQDLDLEILAIPKKIALPCASRVSLGPPSSPGHVPNQPTVAVSVGPGGSWAGLEIRILVPPA